MDKWDREALTHEEINMCIEACRTDEERAMVTCLADTGVRKNELIRMRKGWTRFEKGKYGQIVVPVRDDYVPIPEAQRHTAPGKAFKPRGPKTKKERRIALSMRTATILKEFFEDNTQITMTGKQMWTACVRIGKDAGISKRVTPHVFRHSWINNAYDAGVTKERIAQRVGHVDSHMVETVYLHLDDEETDAKLDEGGMLDV